MSKEIVKSTEKMEDELEKAIAKDKNAFLIGQADTLLESLDFVLFNDDLYVKSSEGYYTKEVLNELVKSGIIFTSRQFNELLYQLKIRAKKIDTCSAFKLANGYLIIGENGNCTFSEKYDGFTPFYLDVTYDAKANDENVIKFLDDVSCSNKEINNMLIELIGSIFLIDKSPCKIYYLYGPTGANGKSTFTSMLRAFLGRNLTSNIDINGLNDDTKMYSLIGKLLNISDDSDFSKLRVEKTSRMKSISGQEILTIRPIYQEPITAKFFCTLVVSCNNLPEFDDKTGGLMRRLVIIDFSMKLAKENKKANMVELLSTPQAKSTILNLAIQGINQIVGNNYELTESEYVNKTISDYFNESDTVRSFLIAKNNGKDIEDKYVSDVYEAYVEYCTNDIAKKELAKNAFGTQMKLYGYVSQVKTNLDKGKKSSRRVYKKDNTIISLSLD